MKKMKSAGATLVVVLVLLFLPSVLPKAHEGSVMAGISGAVSPAVHAQFALQPCWVINWYVESAGGWVVFQPIVPPNWPYQLDQFDAYLPGPDGETIHIHDLCAWS